MDRTIRHHSRIGWFLLALVLCCAVIADAAPRRSAGQHILMQGFGWNSQSRGVPSRWYKLVGDRARDIAELGVTMIWLPPVSRSVSPQGYLPGDYYDVGTEQSPTFYGDRDQLVTCLRSLDQAGLLAIADIVVNHRCASHQDANGVWNIYNFASGKARWDGRMICTGEYGGSGQRDSGDNFGPAPDLDHANSSVQSDIIEWLKWLKSLGFDGWRYDFSRGYSPEYTAIYDKATNPAFSVGEIWTDMAFSGSSLNPNQDAHRQVLCNWLDKAGDKAAAFDFTTKGILQVAVMGEYWRLRDSSGKAAGLIGWWPARAVTFLDNHDTGSQQSHWPFPGEKIMQGYAYILTHPGTPCVFWEHVYDWKLREPIKKLIDARRRCGIVADSKLEIAKAEQGLYAAFVGGNLAMKLGPNDWNPGDGFELLASGDQFAVWGKKAAARR
ncbi:MAG TPA: alpha-amylase C-terminal beta-sheet domain-containing protein [Candidatus Ozemobacteraceae bacterium]|nr:alpha-amylase C-terminal beta-sheet domain-containing protein [Candidatus Ozemobacteraceae bacterium]